MHNTATTINWGRAMLQLAPRTKRAYPAHRGYYGERLGPIIIELCREPTGLSLADLREELPDWTEHQVRHVVHNLVVRGDLENLKAGQRRSPGRYRTVVFAEPEQD